MSLREAFIDAAMQQDTDECILWPFAAELRDLRTSGASHIALGAKYGVEPAYIGKLRRGLRQ